MYIGVEGDAHIRATEYHAQALNIKAFFHVAGCEGMPKGMEVKIPNTGTLEHYFEV